MVSTVKLLTVILECFVLPFATNCSVEYFANKVT